MAGAASHGHHQASGLGGTRDWGPGWWLKPFPAAPKAEEASGWWLCLALLSPSLPSMEAQGAVDAWVHPEKGLWALQKPI